MAVTSVTLPTAFAAGSYTPVFDPTGTLPANLVSGEKQVIAANSGSNLLFLVPSYAPFLTTSLVATYTPTGSTTARTLVSGTDYAPCFKFLSATYADDVTGGPGGSWHAGIVLFNNQLAGTIGLSYQTVGGVWCNTPAINQALSALTGIDPYLTAYEQVVSFSGVFPQPYGPWDKTDTTGTPSVILALLGLINEISTAASAGTTITTQGIAHLINVNNPHNDSKAGIGLGNVANYPPATNTQAADTTNNSVYITPAQLKIAFAAGLPHAQDLLMGVFQLNAALSLSDQTDAAKVLTASSFLQLIQQSGSPLFTAFNRSQCEATFSPYPFNFPATWNGSVYANMTALLQGISNVTGVSPLEFASGSGKIWFPVGTVVPSLTVVGS